MTVGIDHGMCKVWNGFMYVQTTGRTPAGTEQPTDKKMQVCMYVRLYFERTPRSP